MDLGGSSVASGASGSSVFKTHTHTHMIHLCALQLVYSDLEALGFRDEATLEDGILL